MERVKEFLKSEGKWIIVFFCMLAFLLIAEDVFNKELMKGDVIGYSLVSKFLISTSLTPFVEFIANLGGAISLISFSIVLFLVIKNKKIGLSIIANLGIVTILNQALKFLLRRPRPTGYRLVEETGFSFPSGHSMVSLAFYGYLIYLVYKYIKNKYIKWTIITILSMLILSIGISRIYLGVHYTSDVIGGFLMSFSYLVIYICVVKKYLFKPKN